MTFFMFSLFIGSLVACAKESAIATNPEYGKLQGGISNLPPVWSKLAIKLQKNGIQGSDVIRLLASLPPVITQSPMGRKIRELYNKKFFPKSVSRSQYPYYKGVVTASNADLCRKYIETHRDAFNYAYAKYGVSPAIASSLLFVETRLGKVLGDVPENAFYTLASMAMSEDPQDISSWLPKLQGYQKHYAWLEETMQKRADWAFNEFKALIKHMIKDRIEPDRLPGSIYGAVGLCQFMPSNISVYGADGDGDGRVDLFTDSDSIASLARYLERHGWRKGMNDSEKHKLLMTYNHSTVYANTILALSKLVENPALDSDSLPNTSVRPSRKRK